MQEKNFLKNHLLCFQFSFKLSYANCFLKQYVTKCILWHTVSIKGNYFKHSVEFSFSLKFAFPCLYFKSMLQSIKAITLGLGKVLIGLMSSCKIEDDSPGWLWTSSHLSHTLLWELGKVIWRMGKLHPLLIGMFPDQYIFGVTCAKSKAFMCCCSFNILFWTNQVFS